MIYAPRALCRQLCAHCALVGVILTAGLPVASHSVREATAREISEQRLTPVVAAVRQARPAVVSIRGQKTAASQETTGGPGEAPRQVNGMGTGTIVDERGYILTNHHVVSDVRRIEVTLDDGRSYTAELTAFDAAADLAIIKIPANKPLPVIRIGTSSDLMEGESVIALGNAYGYEQTVTRGIISALGRDVQVSDVQSYDDLIQTDASINPGNSGGPLLNIDGEMVGVNVAVRAGAQGIGFAIPVDSAMVVAARLLNVQRLRSTWHGIVTRPGQDFDGPPQVSKVDANSPAELLGIQPGDEILRVGSMSLARPLDLERAFLDQRAGDTVPVEVRRNGQTAVLNFALAESKAKATVPGTAMSADAARIWDLLGLALSEEPSSTFQRRNIRYRGGMRVERVRPESPADQEGILPGDILIGMHKWETISEQDIQYIISRPSLPEMGKLKFYVLRGQNTLTGNLSIASKSDGPSEAVTR